MPPLKVRPDISRIILFLFHNDWETCADHLKLLRMLNPEVPIFGIFGGEEFLVSQARALLDKYFADVFVIKGRDARWKWLNTDLSVRLWYQEVGYKINFDMAHVLQWDILFLDSMQRVYAHIPKGCVGLTGITESAKIETRWHKTTVEPWKTQYVQFKEFARNKLQYQGKFWACLGPGYCLPKRFLDLYASFNIPIPDIMLDEVRVPLFAKYWDFPIVDTGFYPTWHDPEVERFFNADSVQIEDALILDEMRRRHGRRVFHPYRKPFPYIDQIKSGFAQTTLLKQCRAFFLDNLTPFLNRSSRRRTHRGGTAEGCPNHGEATRATPES